MKTKDWIALTVILIVGFIAFKFWGTGTAQKTATTATTGTANPLALLFGQKAANGNLSSAQINAIGTSTNSLVTDITKLFGGSGTNINSQTSLTPADLTLIGGNGSDSVDPNLPVGGEALTPSSFTKIVKAKKPIKGSVKY